MLAIIKLIRILVYDKKAKIKDQKTYRSFMNLLETFLEEPSIDFDKLFQHPFLAYKSECPIESN